ncbi:hypothetical protein Nepgr_033865 [Nepenthes gracilis]|uniref:Uncharacterized protein n=1 Tax=Nepenthes gracilis TaxID=150966 RepID=A0AAD3TML6_NEPGR|nr:hypothetical protein Nepgr_033865 [Nepenthes gracilis]
MSVEIQVDYQSRPKPHAIGRTDSQKGTRRVKEGFKAHDSLMPDVARSVPSVTTGSLMEGSSEVISSDALTSITRVDVPSDLSLSGVQIDGITAEAPSVAACISPGIVMNPVVAEGSVLDESARNAPGIISSSEDGPISLPLQADVDPPCAPVAVGSVADALDADGLPSIDSVVQFSDVYFFLRNHQQPGHPAIHMPTQEHSSQLRRGCTSTTPQSMSWCSKDPTSSLKLNPNSNRTKNRTHIAAALRHSTEMT